MRSSALLARAEAEASTARTPVTEVLGRVATRGTRTSGGGSAGTKKNVGGERKRNGAKDAQGGDTNGEGAKDGAEDGEGRLTGAFA